MDIGAFLKAREQAAAIDGIGLGPLRGQPPRPEGERGRFWQWVDDETPSTQIGSSLRRTLAQGRCMLTIAIAIEVEGPRVEPLSTAAMSIYERTGGTCPD